MDYLPLFLNVRGRRIVVDGGGTIAARRTEAALTAGANVFVFEPELSDEFAPLLSNPALTHVARKPVREDFSDCYIAYGASEDETRDRNLHAWAHEAGALVNVADVGEYCDFITPSVVDRSPLVVAISTGGAAPIIARILRARIEALIPAGYGRLASFLGRFRQAIADNIKGSDIRRHFWEGIIEGPVADLFLSGDKEGAGKRLEQEIEAGSGKETEELARGEVYLVGTGPGDPGLLTFRALRLMQRADVVLYDRLVSQEIMRLVRRDAERIDVGKQQGNHTMPQNNINQLMVDLAQKGKRVLRLKGGDPFMFGRGGEEIEELTRHGVPFQIIPGITAAVGSAAYAGIPLTHRDHAQSCLFVTAHGREGKLDLDWKALVRPAQTIVVYMGLSNLKNLTEGFIRHGADPETPAALVDKATRPDQQVIVGSVQTLHEKVEKSGVRGPAIIIIGDVVKLHPQLKWDVPRGQPVHKMSLKAQQTL